MLFLILCLYVSLYYIRPSEWVNENALRDTSMFQVMGIISIILMVIAIAKGKIRIFRYKTDVMVLGFSGAIVLSHLSHAYVWGAINSFNDILPSILSYFLVVYAINSEKKIKVFVVLLIVLSLFLSFEAILQSITGFSTGGMAPKIQISFNANGDEIQYLRAQWFGPFNDPNDLGLAMIIPIPFLVNLLFNKRYLISCLCLPFLLYGVYLTNSRGAMLALMVSLLAYLVLRFRSVKGGIISVVAILLIIFFGPSRTSQMSGVDESAYGRIEAWYQGFQMFKANPIFGIGKGMFTDYHQLTAHNSFILVLAELGILGSLFFVGMFFYPLYSAKLIFWHYEGSEVSDQRRSFMVASFSVLIGLLIGMFFLSRSYVLLPYMMVGLVMVIINNFNEQSCTTLQNPQSEGYHLFMITGLVIFEIIFINIIVKIFI
jgi:putative inorganic carbon (hco3(-)) transporter